MQNNNILDNLYEIQQNFSRNNISMTSLVRDLNNNNQYVAKIILNNQNDFQNEIQITIIASGLNNPNIIRLIRHGVGTLTFQGEVKNKINFRILS